MTGVAGPLLMESRQRGLRFLLGLLVGGMLTAGLVGLLVDILSLEVGRLVDVDVRLVLLLCLVVFLGLADIIGKTPHIWRQVPQRFIRIFSPGKLGLIWGSDLGLLVTTQKSTSLLWAYLGYALLFDARAVEVLPVMFAVSTLLEAALALRPMNMSQAAVRRTRWIGKKARQAAGGVLLASATVPLASILNL